MDMLAHVRMFAAYNGWANRLLYQAAGRLSDELYRADRGAFFKSVHGTLSHILVTDRIWLERFSGQGVAVSGLDAMPYEHFADLRRAREVEDGRIAAYVAGLTAADLGRSISYTRVSSPEPIVQPLGPALAHVFNHQTHHRGQAHCLLTGLVGEAPPLDLLFFQRETGIGAR